MIQSLNNLLESYVSRETKEELENFVTLLLKWNKSMSLVANSTIKEVWTRHILDSAQLLNYVDKDISVIDIGSGGGFPGVILSILGAREVFLVEKDVRKAAFLLEASKLSKNKINVINEKIEVAKELKCDLLTSRAFAPLDVFIDLCYRQILDCKRSIIFKGVNVDTEIFAAQRKHSFEYVKNTSILNSNSYLIEIFNLRKKGNR